MPASVSSPRRFRPSSIDWLLLLLTLIWGSNFSVVKFALSEIPPLSFTALRLVVASGLFLVVMTASGHRPPPRRDLGVLLGLAFTGHLLYQLCFMTGLARTSVSNSALIIGSGPIAMALLSVAVGHERLTRWHWIGTILSLYGLWLVVGRPASAGGESLLGDLLMVGAVLCWSVYTVGARPLLTRRSPMVVTGYSLVLGTLMFVPFGVADLVRLDWSAVSVGAWAGLVYSAVFALCVAYLIWYMGVQRIGSARTGVYANMVPVVAIVFATLWLGEPLGLRKLTGAAAILAGVALTKLGAVASVLPPEE